MDEYRELREMIRELGRTVGEHDRILNRIEMANQRQADSIERMERTMGRIADAAEKGPFNGKEARILTALGLGVLLAGASGETLGAIVRALLKQ